MGGGEIEVGEKDLAGAARGEVKERIADDGVVEHVGMMAVFENQHGRGLGIYGLCSVGFRSGITVSGALRGSIAAGRARRVYVVNVG